MESLAGKLAGRVDVVSCMVDRVCTGCEVSGEGVNVIAEPWRGSIVVLDPKLHGGSLGLGLGLARVRVRAS